MTREQVLSILNSERTRLQEKCNMSGCSFATILLTISTLVLEIISVPHEGARLNTRQIGRHYRPTTFFLAYYKLRYTFCS